MIDTERNRAAYVALVEVLNGRRALAFAGTGVVSSLGYPSWDGLITRLATEVRALRGEQVQSNGVPITIEQVLREFSDRPLVQAQILKENLGEQYFPLMARLFGTGGSSISTVLVVLPTIGNSPIRTRCPLPKSAKSGTAIANSGLTSL